MMRYAASLELAKVEELIREIDGYGKT